MDFLSNASTPAPVAIRRSPFAAFEERRSPPHPDAGTPRRGASRRSRPDASRSRSHSRTRAEPTLNDLEDQIRGMKRQRWEDQKNIALLAANLAKIDEYIVRTAPEHERTRKWAEDNAKRLDALEGQVREQTNEAKRHAEAKCKEIDGKLRTELDTNIPKFLGELESKVANHVKELEDKLKAWEGQTLAGCFKNIEG